MGKEIVGKECKFTFHLPAEVNEDGEIYREDTHVIKEVIHYSDGTLEPKLKVITNYQRPFWLTQEHRRNHTQKKESEDINNLKVYMTTESAMVKNIGSRIGGRYAREKQYRVLANYPYLYGTDIKSTTYIKHQYQRKYPDAISNYTFTVLDIENDVNTKEMSVITIADSTRSYSAIRKGFVPNPNTAVKDLNYLYNKYIPKTDISEKITPTFELFDTELEMIKAVFAKIHEWGNDFMAVWNITYDLGVILDVLEREGVDPKDIFSDPRLPENLRYFKFKKGVDSKMTASGKRHTFASHQQWHTIYAPAMVYWIDAMCAYNYIRVNTKEVQGGYSLDNILFHTLGKDLQKLKFPDETSGPKSGVDWHIFMAEKKPLEYIIYNVWDCLSVLHLDQKTTDLSMALPTLAGISGFDKFNSGPKRIIDDLHFFYIDHGRVLATKPSTMDNGEDELLGMEDWIVLMPSNNIMDNGLTLLNEAKGLKTNARAHVSDADQVSGYPSNGQAANISKDTTKKEIISIGNMDKTEFKPNNINLMFGYINSIDYCKNMFNFPNLKELL